MPIVVTLLYILFVLSAVVLIVVILLQEGKGGGLGDALGQAGQQTFGVGAKGINQFTAAVALVFLASAVTITMVNGKLVQGSVLDKSGSQDAGAAIDQPPTNQGEAPPAAPPTSPQDQ